MARLFYAWLPGAVALACCLAHAPAASACAACGGGDPTLTALGTEKPLRNRMRASLDARHRTDTMGDPGPSEMRLAEQRMDAQLAWAPHDRVFLLAGLPLLHRDVTYGDALRRRSWGPGDIELRAKVFLFQDRAFSPRHLVAAVAGVKLPTAPLERRDNGTLLPIELQPGTGSLDGLAGVSYAFFSFPWSVYASAQAVIPTSGTSGFRASRSVRNTIALQRHLGNLTALRAALDTRFDGKALEDGQPAPTSGGFIAFATPEILISPMTDLTLSVWVRASVFNRLDGRHLEPFAAGGAITYDF